jgi:hypothetical protein
MSYNDKWVYWNTHGLRLRSVARVTFCVAKLWCFSCTMYIDTMCYKPRDTSKSWMMKGPVYDNGKMNNRIFPLAIVLYVLLRYKDYDYEYIQFRYVSMFTYLNKQKVCFHIICNQGFTSYKDKLYIKQLFSFIWEGKRELPSQVCSPERGTHLMVSWSGILGKNSRAFEFSGQT